MLSIRDSLLSFWIGSSIASGIVSFGYIGAGFSRWRKSGNWNVKSDINKFEWIMGFILVLLGIFNVIAQNLVNAHKEFSSQKNESYSLSLTKNSELYSGRIKYIPTAYCWNVVVGIVFGFVLSSIGRFGFNFPVRVFNFSVGRDWMVHPMAMGLYAVVFGTIIGMPSWYFIHNK